MTRHFSPPQSDTPHAIRRDDEARFFHLSPDLLAIADAEGRLCHVNAAWERLLGYSANVLADSDAPLRDLAHPHDQAAAQSAWKRLHAKQTRVTWEARLHGRNGEYNWLEWSAAPGPNGQVFVSGRDVSERREQEQAISDAHQKLTFYLVNSPLALVEWDKNGRAQYWSPQTEQLFGWNADTVIGKQAGDPDWPFLHAGDAQAFCGVLNGLLADHAPGESTSFSDQRASVACRHVRPDGTPVFCEWYHSALRDENGQIVAVSSLVLDVTERRAREAELVQIRKAVESASDAIVISDAAGRAIHVNQAFADLFGYTLEEMRATGTDVLYPAGVVPQEIRAALVDGAPWAGEIELAGKTGERLPVTLRTNPIRSDGPVAGATTLPPLGWITVCTDLRERKQAEEELVHQARHDSLTGLPNRAYFLQRLDRAFAWNRQRPAAGSAFAVLFIDLDNFKVVNDSLGHEAGDRLLCEAAQRLLACVRPEDMVARLGGDEFTILLQDVAGEDAAAKVAERVCEQLRAPIVLSGREVFVSASIGIAASRPGHEQAEDVLRDADVAMYQAKTGGKANFVSFDVEMNASAMERLELEMDLRRALDASANNGASDDLHIQFQPIVQLASGRVTEVEALLRWNHPQRGSISPAKFIPIAEETGLILPLGQWVLERACRQARFWQTEYPSDPPLVMSVNLSTRQLQQDDLVEIVRRTLDSTGIAPATLKLEITESVMMLDSATMLARLHELRALGVRLAVDDFGTGYSSMSYLSALPIDTLKIDRAFISRLGIKTEDEAIVRAILTMAKTMGLKVTAEGIETEAQLGELQELGCDRGQGYLFARPLSVAALNDLLGGEQRAPAITAPGDDAPAASLRRAA